MNWNELGLKIAKEIEKDVMPYFGKKEGAKIVGYSPSGDTTELVDRISEDIVLKYLKPLNVNIVSEEIGTINNNSEWTVVIDPIDGSFNFTIGFPCFGFCFAVFKNNNPYYGLTYEFLTKNTYEAFAGKGAFLNGEKIKVKEYNEKEAVISYYSKKNLNLIGKVRRVRIMGAFGIEMAYVAKGALDGIFDIRPYVRTTDFASSYIICKEAGAIITDENGHEFKFNLNATDRYNIIVANDKKLLNMILEEINK
ncbi:bifunctional fructose-bisphosphatase/inositol-phosphate phosphatase [Methanothermococcus sp.]|uniref:bifunctional fructose-bisphosphatase/inositol-phosphate phosphatase n=1 Tax=Methanothermococcus sp. TaxID=2614238 RepID=UPI0025EF3545|nr:bifunctional fructose-bisphosphatase/inositol-phosphate phosphatase [Methanothermococcus sp.]